ncbi:hypothetical protein NL676_034375 [Syzygium grande]|nr:hypothetical protein NL676_034375 [Syzygium grande]
MAVVIKFALVLSLAILVVLPPPQCRALEVPIWPMPGCVARPIPETQGSSAIRSRRLMHGSVDSSSLSLARKLLKVLMAVIKFVLVLSLAILVLLLPLCRPLEVPNYQGAEDWPELTAGRRHQRIREEDRTGFNMRRLGGAIPEHEPEPVDEPEFLA